jgi:hypothetical protein
MDWKGIVKDAGLGVGAVLALVYVCGWQFYLALLHNLSTDLHFFIPPEAALGGGVEPFCTVLAVGCLPAVLLASVGRTMKPASTGRLLTRLAAALCGLGLPYVVVLITRAWQPIALSAAEWIRLGLGGMLLSSVSYVVTRRFRERNPQAYVAYGLMLVLFVFDAVEYAVIRGKREALGLLESGARTRVQLTVSDAALQAKLADDWFIPVLEARDDLLLFRVHDGGKRGNLLLVKKAEIQAMEYGAD